MKNNKLKLFVVDAHARTHLLTRDHDSDCEIISPEKKQKPDKLPWTEFVKQVRQQYYQKSPESSPSKASTSAQLPSTSPSKPVNESHEDEDESDDDFAETFRAVEEETSRKKAAVTSVIEVGHIPSKTSAIDNFIGRMNALKSNIAFHFN